MSRLTTRRTVLAGLTSSSVVGLSTRIRAASSEPTLDKFDPDPIPDDGSVYFRLVISTVDSHTLQSVTIESPTGATKTESLSGTSADLHMGFTDDSKVQEGQYNEIDITMQDDQGSNTVTRSMYARKFSRLDGGDSTSLPAEIGGIYNQWVGDAADASDETKFWLVECADVDGDGSIDDRGTGCSPAVGEWTLDNGWSLNRHLDQMQGYGIEPLMVTYNGQQGNRRHFAKWADTQLARRIDFEVFLDFPKFWKWSNEDFKKHIQETQTGHLQDLYLDRDWSKYSNDGGDFAGEDKQPLTYNTVDGGKPVITFWDAGWFHWADDPRTYIKDNWTNGFSGFVEEFRNQLSLNGNDPYLVAVMVNPVDWMDNQERASYIANFDAVSGWTHDAHEYDTWNDLLCTGTKSDGSDGYTMTEEYAQTKSWADNNGMDFIPCVFPGFNDAYNTNSNKSNCWGHNRTFPRSSSGFSDMLELANYYKSDTPGRINVATWCDWGEGHQVEPGDFHADSNYGKDYIAKVKSVQEKDSAKSDVSCPW